MSPLQAKTKFETITWEQLISEDELEIILNPPSYITDIPDGSLEDQISQQLMNTIEAASDDKYQQALRSTNVIQSMNNKSVRLPGFIVPLEFDHKKNVIQFFLVPYFGACIHVPPPPPNQIVLVNYPKGINLKDLWRPYWISGNLTTSITKKDIGMSAYSIQMHGYEDYKDED